MKRLSSRMAIGIILVLLVDCARVEISSRRAIASAVACYSKQDIVRALGEPATTGKWRHEGEEGSSVAYSYTFIWEPFAAAILRAFVIINPYSSESAGYGNWFERWCSDNSREVNIQFDQTGQVRKISYRSLFSQERVVLVQRLHTTEAKGN